MKRRYSRVDGDEKSEPVNRYENKSCINDNFYRDIRSCASVDKYVLNDLRTAKLVGSGSYGFVIKVGTTLKSELRADGGKSVRSGRSNGGGRSNGSKGDKSKSNGDGRSKSNGDDRSKSKSKNHASSNVGPMVAIKFMVYTPTNIKKTRFLSMKNELAYTKLMGDLEIGPKVYDSFHYIFNLGAIKKHTKLPGVKHVLELFYRKTKETQKKHKNSSGIGGTILDLFDHGKDSTQIELQCIVMDVYDMDADDYMYDPDGDINVKADIIMKMCSLQRKQIQSKLFCYDIKPSNFVVNINKKTGRVDVRMIDFGASHCTQGSVYKNISNDSYFYTDGEFTLTSLEMMHISNFMQLCVPYLNNSMFRYMTTENRAIIYDAYTNKDPIVHKFLKYPKWTDVITAYIKRAEHNFSSSLRDPSTTLVWYCATTSKDYNTPTGLAETKKKIITTMSVLELFLVYGEVIYKSYYKNNVIAEYYDYDQSV